MVTNCIYVCVLKTGRNAFRLRKVLINPQIYELLHIYIKIYIYRGAKFFIKKIRMHKFTIFSSFFFFWKIIDYKIMDVISRIKKKNVGRKCNIYKNNLFLQTKLLLSSFFFYSFLFFRYINV